MLPLLHRSGLRRFASIGCYHGRATEIDWGSIDIFPSPLLHPHEPKLVYKNDKFMEVPSCTSIFPVCAHPCSWLFHDIFYFLTIRPFGVKKKVKILVTERRINRHTVQPIIKSKISPAFFYHESLKFTDISTALSTLGSRSHWNPWGLSLCTEKSV